jgi:hypothetical protein
MSHDQNEVASLRSRVEKSIHESHQLVRQARVLQVLTTRLVNDMDAPSQSRGCWGAVQERLDSLGGNCVFDQNMVIELALQITRANMGNLQLLDHSSGVLHITAQQGFRRAFLDYFDRVHEGEAACGKAFQTRRRIMVEDVTESVLFHQTAALEVLLDAGIRAVQSNPLIGPSGTLHGILSTHWSSPHRPSAQELLQVDLFTRFVATRFESSGDI